MIREGDFDTVTPELVLVDPVLAAEARRLLPDPADCLVLPPRRAAHAPDALPAPVPAPPSALHVPTGPTVEVGAVASVPRPAALARLAGSDVALPRALEARTLERRAPPVLPDPVTPLETAAPAPRARPSALAVLATLFVALVVGSPALDLLPWGSDNGPTFVSASSSPAPTPAPPADADRVAVLGWPKVAGADVYDVVLWRDGRRVTDLWPETNRVVVRRDAAPGGRTLAPGTYQWFAFAGFRESGNVRFGRAVASGEFEVK